MHIKLCYQVLVITAICGKTIQRESCMKSQVKSLESVSVYSEDCKFQNEKIDLEKKKWVHQAFVAHSLSLLEFLKQTKVITTGWCRHHVSMRKKNSRLIKKKKDDTSASNLKFCVVIFFSLSFLFTKYFAIACHLYTWIFQCGSPNINLNLLHRSCILFLFWSYL